MSKLVLSLFFLVCFSTIVYPQTNTVDLTCEHKINPIGITVLQPRLSWKLTSQKRNISQKSYRVQVATTPDFAAKNLVLDAKVPTSESILQAYRGKALKSGLSYYWRVKVWDNQNFESAWSKVAFWKMGLLTINEWKAQWIEPTVQPFPVTDNSPAFMLRKNFSLKNKIASATAYVTSHGFYELSLNGKKVGDEVLTPGWTVYQKRLQYQTYDVTSYLNQGENAVGAMLGEGWYRSQITRKRTVNNAPFYDNNLGLLCQIVIKYDNGKQEIISSDDTWKSTNEGPIRVNEIYDGETYDATKEIIGWNTSTFNDSNWSKVTIANYDMNNLIGTDGVKVQKIQEIKPVKVFRTPKGELVADMGQNMVGWLRLNVKGAKGTKITIQHGEVLDRDGNFYNANLRKAKATLTYTLKGDGVEVYEPRFSFFGFRYVLIEGMELSANNLVGVVVHSNMQPTGNFECSDPLVTQLQKNIQWGQRGNFIDVPTDCPQRDERLGWTGDAQAFVRTAAYNYDVAAFFTKWLKDVAADQRPDGAVPNIIPDVLNPKNSPSVSHAAGWGDVAIIAPWTIYLTYGDKELLTNQYPSMKKCMEFLQKKIGPSCIAQKDDGFGDWLSYKPDSIGKLNGLKDGFTDKRYINTAFYGYMSLLMKNTAIALKKPDDIKLYTSLFEDIKTAFNKEYIDATGKVKRIDGKESDSQTAYVLALMFDLLPKELKSKAAAYLVADVKSRDNHLSTGFLGTPYLCHVLSDNGYTDVAYDLLLQKTYPSWLFPVTMGATTIWERWDGQKPDGTFQTTTMNSFNHYAYGAVGDWMYRVATGIEIDPLQPGYKHFYIQPKPTREWIYAKSSLNSPYGEIHSGWEIKEGIIKLNIKIPVNSTATITLPKAKDEVLQDNKPFKASNFREIKNTDKGMQFEAGSGEYTFEYKF